MDAFRIRIVFLLLLTFASAQSIEKLECGLTSEDAYKSSGRGGLYMTEAGEVRALVVFVQFHGDQSHPSSNHWPPGQDALFSNDVLDADAQVLSTDQNLTHYFREMSLGHLTIVGDAVNVTLDQTLQWYLDNGRTYGHASRDALAKLDASVNFTDYDNWTFGVQSHQAGADGIVDLVIMIYRENLPHSFHPGNGAASLGFGDPLLEVDNGAVKIKGNFPGSGVSIEKGSYGRRTDIYAHEIGHLLLGGRHPDYHNDGSGYGFWGLLFANSSLVNAVDRYWLKWQEFHEMNAPVSEDVIVNDFLSGGAALRIDLAGAPNEAFIVENHQQVLPFDNAINQNGDDKGLYIYHIRGTDAFPDFDLEVAEGQFNWINPYWIQNPWNPANPQDSIPVFTRERPNRLGLDSRDAIPTSKMDDEGQQIQYKIYVTDDEPDGIWQRNRLVFGSEFEAFDIDRNIVFSPWSNPSSAIWNNIADSNRSIEILDKHVIDVYTGEAAYTLRIRGSKHEDAPPGNPLLLAARQNGSSERAGIRISWAANLEPDVLGYQVYRQLGTEEGLQLLTPELLADTILIQSDLRYDPQSTTFCTFYVQAVDEQQQVSNFSNPICIPVDLLVNTEREIDATLPDTDIQLSANYPNPFNPQTTIEFQLLYSREIQLKIYNARGQFLKILAGGRYAAGTHKIIWDGTDANGEASASGIYFYVLQAGQEVYSRRMLLLR